jgi:ABC-2 type transport system ATP-binding protein
VLVCNIDAATEPERMKQRVGVALQSTALQEKITPREALRLFCSFYSRCAAPQQLIERFDLAEKADAPFDSLSAGQKQRLALALAFVNEPELLFLDEPTSGLDPQSRRDLHSAILRMRDEGRTVMLSTHHIDEAESLCDRVAILDHGRLAATGTPAELIARSKVPPQVVVKATRMMDPDRLRGLTGVVDVAGQGLEVRLSTSSVSQTVIELVKTLQTDANELLDLHIRRSSLEDVFLELTGAAFPERS